MSPCVHVVKYLPHVPLSLSRSPPQPHPPPLRPALPLPVSLSVLLLALSFSLFLPLCTLSIHPHTRVKSALCHMQRQAGGAYVERAVLDDAVRYNRTTQPATPHQHAVSSGDTMLRIRARPRPCTSGGAPACGKAALPHRFAFVFSTSSPLPALLLIVVFMTAGAPRIAWTAPFWVPRPAPSTTHHSSTFPAE